MFLFEGEFGRFLHTGDFRYHASMLEHPLLSPALPPLDLLILGIEKLFLYEMRGENHFFFQLQR